MRRFMHLLGLGTALLAASACRAAPTGPLGAAAVDNAADAVRRLLAAGHPPDEADDLGFTPLMWAARSNAVKAMAVLLDRGANANARDLHNRWTPLLHAIHKEHRDAVRLLLARGADPNLAAPDGTTPLLMAAGDPDASVVELLLAHGANARVEGPGGTTPLTQAVSGGALSDITDRPLLGGCRPDSVRALLHHDPELRLPKTFAGHHALWWARFNKCQEVLTLMSAVPLLDQKATTAVTEDARRKR